MTDVVLVAVDKGGGCDSCEVEEDEEAVAR